MEMPRRDNHRGEGTVGALAEAKRDSLLANPDDAHGRELGKPISPAQHAILDYGVAATFSHSDCR